MSTTAGLIVSVSGIRGVIGRSLTPADALAFASALGAHVNGGRVVVSQPRRPAQRREVV
jgi:phosphomannomutase